jgi:hypothetical protein
MRKLTEIFLYNRRKFAQKLGKMGFLIGLTLAIAVLCCAVVIFVAFGSFLLESDKAKANRYLAEKYDREHADLR